MAASDGTRLNLAAQLATEAATLQKAVSSRKASARSDTVLIAALADIETAITALCSAVRRLATEVEGDG